MRSHMHDSYAWLIEMTHTHTALLFYTWTCNGYLLIVPLKKLPKIIQKSWEFFVWHFARSHFGYLLDSEDRRWIYQSASSKIKVFTRWSNSRRLMRIWQFPLPKLETFKLESSRWIWKEWTWKIFNLLNTVFKILH